MKNKIIFKQNFLYLSFLISSLVFALSVFIAIVAINSIEEAKYWDPVTYLPEHPRFPYEAFIILGTSVGLSMLVFYLFHLAVRGVTNTSEHKISKMAKV